MSDEIERIRQEIVRLARRKDARIVPRSREMPCRWQPMTVTNPETDLPFTEAGAWRYVADLAEFGHPIDQMIMKRPAGEIGYVLIAPLVRNSADLYIKIQLKGGKIFGRSFHLSTQ